MLMSLCISSFVQNRKRQQQNEMRNELFRSHVHQTISDQASLSQPQASRYRGLWPGIGPRPRSQRLTPRGVRDLTHRVRCNAKISRIETFQFFCVKLHGDNIVNCECCHDTSLVCIQPCIAMQVLLKNAPMRLVCLLPNSVPMGRECQNARAHFAHHHTLSTYSCTHTHNRTTQRQTHRITHRTHKNTLSVSFSTHTHSCAHVK